MIQTRCQLGGQFLRSRTRIGPPQNEGLDLDLRGGDVKALEKGLKLVETLSRIADQNQVLLAHEGLVLGHDRLDVSIFILLRAAGDDPLERLQGQLHGIDGDVARSVFEQARLRTLHGLACRRALGAFVDGLQMINQELHVRGQIKNQERLTHAAEARAIGEALKARRGVTAGIEPYSDLVPEEPADGRHQFAGVNVTWSEATDHELALEREVLVGGTSFVLLSDTGRQEQQERCERVSKAEVVGHRIGAAPGSAVTGSIRVALASCAETRCRRTAPADELHGAVVVKAGSDRFGG